MKRFTVDIRVHLYVKQSINKFFFQQRKANKLYDYAVRTKRLDPVQHKELGSDLAVAKFVTDKCYGKVKYGNNTQWTHICPQDFVRDFKLKQINVSDAKLVTENLDNFVYLDHLEAINLSKNPLLDDFSCDTLASQFRKSKSLKAINVSWCPLISIYGLEALLRIPSLRYITAQGTQASSHEHIDLFVLAAEDEKNCRVHVHEAGRQFESPELESLRYNDSKQETYDLLN